LTGRVLPVGAQQIVQEPFGPLLAVGHHLPYELWAAVELRRVVQGPAILYGPPCLLAYSYTYPATALSVDDLEVYPYCLLF
jgi:hypothetical protein